MSVVLSMQDVGPWRKQLTVEVPAPAVEAETQRVVREFGQRVRLPGFRRGKVPAELVRRRFAKDIEREVIDRLVPRYWRQAQAEKEIEPLLPPSVDEVGDLAPGGTLTFVATVETRPAVELRNVHDFQLPDPEIEPGELDVDKALDDLRARFGEWVPVERAAARGDLVNAQVTQVDELAAGAPEADAPASATSAGSAGEAAAGTAANSASAASAASAAGAAGAAVPAAADPVEFEVGDERVWDELSLAVSGLAAGQESSFVREFEEPPGVPGRPAAAAGQPGAAGHGEHGPEGAATGARRRRFKVQVNAVKERELPALDDELAARVNPELGGLAELRQIVARRLREARIEERHELRQRALLEQLRERHPMDLPQGVVEREVEHLTGDYAESIARRGVRPEQAGIDWQRVREEMRPHAERRVHSRLLLDAVAAAEPVLLTDEEFERALAALARAQKTNTPALRKALHENGRLETLREQLLREKTIRHLMGEPEAAPAAPAGLAPQAAPGAPGTLGTRPAPAVDPADTTPGHRDAGEPGAEPAER